ncbi:MAG: NADH:flavin oxidoreductase/NADH oxidase [Betaproteobacteria bacterium]|nr:MAG: NADH:flavin oxidoreductase/NADH oxidase [Betaproteobacteria bacterium]
MTASLLFTPLELRGTTLPNRIVMSPMCQYSARDGMADDWHLVHLGSRAVGGAGSVMVEATAVAPDGRISPGCLGLWSEQHIAPLARIARFIEQQGAVPAIQLAHAGRKGSCRPSWAGAAALSQDEGGWPLVSASAIAFSAKSPLPRAADADDIALWVGAFAAAARRAVDAGFRIIEIHAAHGYLIHQFLSPLANRRDDAYGGSFENRTRLLRRIVFAVRHALPVDVPLLVRISATDWAPNGWDLTQSALLAAALKRDGVDLIDVSSGGLLPDAAIAVSPSYQVPLSRHIRCAARMPTGAVGLITETAQAEAILQERSADLVFLGRELLREPYWPVKAQIELGLVPRVPVQYLASRRPRAS